VNISDFEASKDDLSFDQEETDHDFDDTKEIERALARGANQSGFSSRSSFDHSLNYDETFDNDDKKSEPKQDLFGEEYYKQLQELGVLVDEDDLPQPRDSLQEFENYETHYSRDYDDEDDEKVAGEIEEFLRKDIPTPTREFLDHDSRHDDVNQRNKPLYGSQGFLQGSGPFDDDSFVQPHEGKRTRPNTASSTRTISSRSFPEISPEEALELYTERLQSLENEEEETLSIPFDQSQSLRSEQNEHREDDEIYFVQSQENDDDDDANSPKPAKMPAYDNENKPSLTLKSRSRSQHSSDGSRSGTPQNRDYRDSDRSRSATPQAEDDYMMDNNGYQSNEDRYDSLTQVTRLDSRNKTQSETEFRPGSALSELSSTASENRSVQRKAKQANGKPPTQQKGGLSHAQSQESFFDHNSGLSLPKKTEKGPKRLLPKPSQEENQSLKMKSKSVSNLNALGPVKPTHMTLSEIRSMNVDNPDLHIDLPELEHEIEPKSNASDAPKGDLTKKLKQETSRRAQATQLVKQLQSDYDKLLSKYALAELTIDQMRLGAKISLHSASPTPSQATSGSLQSAQHLHLMNLAGAQRGSIASASPQTAISSNVFFSGNVLIYL